MNIDNANSQLVDMYTQLRPIVEDVVNKNAKPIDDIIKKIKKNLTTLTNKELQDYMLQLSIETYYFSHIKDMSILKQECAMALLKEGQANSFNSSDGTQSYRNNQATIENVDKQAVNILYNAVANSMKSKLDEAHRIVNVLSGTLISKNAEAKLKGVKEEDENSYNNSV
jgi:hypothetical protein